MDSFSFLKEQVDKPLLFFFIAATNLFDIAGIDLKIFQFIHLFIMGWMVLSVSSNMWHVPRGFRSWQVIVLMLLPLLSVYSCQVLHGQAISLSLIVYRMHLGWVIYFYLSQKQIPLSVIAKTVFIVGLGYTLITLLQQITYPFAPFGSRTLGSAYSSDKVGGVERRMGFWRFMVGGMYFAIIALFFCIRNQISHKKIIVFLFILGIVASGNRQTMFSVFTGIIIFLLFSRNVKHKFLISITLCFGCVFLSLYADAIFGKLANVSGDLNGGRMPSYIFFWNKITNSSMSFWMGNGLGSSGSLYGSEENYYDNFPVTPSDIGIVGTMYYWGGLYVIAYIVCVVRYLLSRRLDVFYKAILFSFLVSCPIASYLWEFDGFMIQGLLFYLCDMDIVFKKEQEYSIYFTQSNFDNNYLEEL